MKNKVFGGFLILLNLFVITTVFYVYRNVSSLAGEISITDADFEKPEKSKKKEKEVIITDEDLQDYKEVFATSGESKEEKVKVLGDNSKVYGMSDGYGNRTLIRSFPNHARLKKIVLRIAGSGTTQVFVYGQNGQVERISGDQIQDVLHASADELANAAKIYQTREERDRLREEKARQKQEEIRAKRLEQMPVIQRNPEFPEYGKPQVTEKSNERPAADSDDPGNDSMEEM